MRVRVRVNEMKTEELQGVEIMKEEESYRTGGKEGKLNK